MRKSVEPEERCESTVLHPVCKDPKPRNASELAGQAKLQDVTGLDTSKKAWKGNSEAAIATPPGQPKLQEMGLNTSKKTRKGNFEVVTSTPPPPRSHSPFEDSVQRKVVGETTAETMSLLSASVEKYCPDNSESSGIKPVPGVSSFQYHVLAVDDSRVDQRVIEKLLKTSAYRGL